MAHYNPADDAEEELKQFFGGVKRFLPRRGEWAVVSLHGWPLAQHKPTGWYIEPKWTRSKGLIYRGVAPDEYGLYAGLREHKSVAAAFREIMHEIDRLDVPHKRRANGGSGSPVLQEFADELNRLVCYGPKGVFRPFEDKPLTVPSGLSDDVSAETQRLLRIVNEFVCGVTALAAAASGHDDDAEELRAAPRLARPFDSYDRDDLLRAIVLIAGRETTRTTAATKGASLAGRAALDAVKKACDVIEWTERAERTADNKSARYEGYVKDARQYSLNTVYDAVACCKGALEGGSVKPAQVRALAAAVVGRTPNPLRYGSRRY